MGARGFGGTNRGGGIIDPSCIKLQYSMEANGYPCLAFSSFMALERLKTMAAPPANRIR